MTFETVAWDDPRAIALRAAMDAETGAMYAGRAAAQTPEETDAVTAALTIDPATIVHTVLLVADGTAVAHAALRPFGDELEVKKVFVAADARGHGHSRALMLELERVALERGIHSLVLQTGDLQVPAIALYVSLGYEPIPVYGAYSAIPFALCYRKQLA
jgi:GNAT superfamily N-acetyltransferase